MVNLPSPNATLDKKLVDFYYPGNENSVVTGGMLDVLESNRSENQSIKVIKQLGDTALSVCLDRIVQTERSKLVDVDKFNPEELSGSELLVAEWVHLGNIQSFDEVWYAAHRFGVARERVEQIRSMVEADMRRTTEAIKQAAEMVCLPSSDRLRVELSLRFGTKIHQDTDPLVVAGLIIAEAAHYGQKRQNNNEDYLTHPVRCGAIYQLAWDQLSCDEGREPDRQHLYLQLFSILTHDAFEDIIEKDGSSFLANGIFRATPLFMRRLLETFGKEESQVERVVEAQRLVTKSRSPSGESQAPLKYQVDCGKSIMSMITKYVDTTDNKNIDTKQPRTDQEKQKIDKTDRERQLFIESINRRLGGINPTVRDYWGKAIIAKISEIGGHGEAFKSAVPYISLGRRSSVTETIDSGDQFFLPQERPVAHI